MKKLLFAVAIFFLIGLTPGYTQHLKENGTPDMRYKENKNNSVSPTTPIYNSQPSTATHIKKDGTPDMRYKENNPKSNQYIEKDKEGKIIRSESAKRDFMKQTGYPKGRPGYVIDHVIPLKKGGCDCPDNMQWQTIEEAKEKDKWE